MSVIDIPVRALATLGNAGKGGEMLLESGVRNSLHLV